MLKQSSSVLIKGEFCKMVFFRAVDNNLKICELSTCTAICWGLFDTAGIFSVKLNLEDVRFVSIGFKVKCPMV